MSTSKTIRGRIRIGVSLATVGLGVALSGMVLASPTTGAPAAAATPATKDTAQRSFKTPEEASEALVAAAEKFDVKAMKDILGSAGVDLVVTDDEVQDRNQSKAFAAAARAKSRIVRDAKNPKIARLMVGADDWPLPIPMVEEHGAWRFDTEAGRTEILYRRVGRNELDAIEACRNYVRAQNEYALHRHDGSMVNQYAQRIISTPGKQDGLVWRDKAGALQGPLAVGLANALAEGYTSKTAPYHGYYFKILKGQGAYAPLGTLDYVLHGAMIGGFALIAAPSDYAVTGIKTFMVSQDGIVYESDLGPTTLDQFRSIDRFNPDMSWSPVKAP
jgi:Protein of unknown function (DUF2950)